MGITNFNNRNIAQHNQLLQKYFANGIVLKFFLGIVYTIIAIITGFLLGFDGEKFHLFFFLICNQFLLSLILYIRSNISGLHLYKTDSIISVTDRLLLISLCGYLLLFHRESFVIEWFIYAQSISYFITFIIAFVIVYQKINLFKIKLDFTFLLIIFKQSYPFALLVLLMGLYTRMDMVMIEYLLEQGAHEAGIYAQAFRVLDAVAMFAFLFATLLLPMFSKMLKQKESVAQLVKLSFLLIITPSLVFVIGTVFYGWELMKLMYHEHYDESTHIFKVLILGFLPIASSYIFGTLLTANNNIRYLNYVAFSGLLINFITNIILIPIYGGYGAAIASLGTLSYTAIIQILLAKKIFSFTIDWKTITMLAAYIILVSCAYHYLKGVMENWIYNLVLIGLVCVILAFATGLFRIKELLKIFTKETPIP